MAKQKTLSPEATLEKLASGKLVTLKPAAAKALLDSVKTMRAALDEGRGVAYIVVSEASYAGFSDLRKKANVFIGNAMESSKFMKGVE